VATTLVVKDYKLLEILGALDPGESAMVTYPKGQPQHDPWEIYEVTLDMTKAQLEPLEEGVSFK
jgi:hypothetical protein